MFSLTILRRLCLAKYVVPPTLKVIILLADGMVSLMDLKQGRLMGRRGLRNGEVSTQ